MNARTAVVQVLVAMSGLMLAAGAHGQGPAGSTGECKDGTFSSATSKSGACAGHGGVKQWYEPKKAGPIESDAPAAALKPAPAATATGSTSKSAVLPAAAAPGGGAGKVWVNTSSKVYHCSTDQWYGKTKRGEYMSEADAKAKGNHAEHGKACS